MNFFRLDPRDFEYYELRAFMKDYRSDNEGKEAIHDFDLLIRRGLIYSGNYIAFSLSKLGLKGLNGTCSDFRKGH